MGTNFITELVEGTTRYNKTDMEAQSKALDKAITYKHNFLFHCDGEITWSAGTLTWSDKMRIIFISDAGLAIANEIAAGNIALADNEYAYVDLSETNNAVLAVAKTTITTAAAAGYIGVGRVVLGYRNTASDNFYPVAIKKKLETALTGVGLELTGYSETEVGPVDASGGTANIDYAAGNVQRVTIGDGVDAALTFTNLPTGKSCSATLRLEMAGAVPTTITLQGTTIDTTGVTATGEILVEAIRISTDWYMAVHHAS